LLPRSGVPANRELKSTTFIFLIKVAEEDIRSSSSWLAGTPSHGSYFFLAGSNWHILLLSR
jgi:hypothetical protein